MDPMEGFEEMIVKVVLAAQREGQSLAQSGIQPLHAEIPSYSPSLPRETPAVTPPISRQVESSATSSSRSFVHGEVDILNNLKK